MLLIDSTIKKHIIKSTNFDLSCGKECRGGTADFRVHPEYKNRLRVFYKNSIRFKPPPSSGGAELPSLLRKHRILTGALIGAPMQQFSRADVFENCCILKKQKAALIKKIKFDIQPKGKVWKNDHYS